MSGDEAVQNLKGSPIRASHEAILGFDTVVVP